MSVSLFLLVYCSAAVSVTVLARYQSAFSPEWKSGCFSGSLFSRPRHDHGRSEDLIMPRIAMVPGAVATDEIQKCIEDRI